MELVTLGSLCVIVICLVVLNFAKDVWLRAERLRVQQAHQNFDELKKAFDSLNASYQKTAKNCDELLAVAEASGKTIRELMDQNKMLAQRLREAEVRQRLG